MTFIHIADLHANRARLQQCLKVLDTIYKYILSKEERPYLLIAGDFWDSAIQNTENSGFPEYVAAMTKIINITKVFMIYGTPSHENAGSLEVFRHLGAKVYERNTFESFEDFEIVAIPEPRRSNYISTSSEETNKLINKDNEKFILSLSEKEKPRIVMYHGEIQGAVYQNNMVASSPVALNKKLLKKADADYIAVGHIHLPQMPWDNCAYSGSCCPVNAGEHHDGCFNVITIAEQTSVEKVSFGFPVNITEYALFDDVENFKKKDYTNKNLTLKFTIDKALKKSFDQRLLEEEIKKSTNANSVRINFEYKSETNIRSEEIAKEKSVIEKFKIYCELNDIKITDDTVAKLQDIQDNMLIDSFVPCDSFELESLQLRGAIGIKDGMGLDEYNIDFTKFHNGIVGLVGANGRGKCIVGDTLILSDSGFETIGDYDNGIRGFQPFEKRLVTDKHNSDISSHFYSEDVVRTIKVTNDLGLELEGTEDHPVLCCLPGFDIAFKKLKDIKEGDFVVIPRGMNSFPKDHFKFNFTPNRTANSCKVFELPKETSENLAKILGYYVANGCSYGRGIEFCTANDKIAKDYKDSVESLFPLSVYLSNSKDRTAKNYTLASSFVHQFFTHIFGGKLETARYKTVPECILKGTKEEQRLFLRTLFDCDASLCDNVFEFLSASKQVATCVQNMLLNFGIISKRLVKRVKGYDWDYHRVSISSKNIDMLMDLILFDSLKYSYKRSSPINANKDVIPYLTDTLHEILDPSKSGLIELKDRFVRNDFKGYFLGHNLTYENLKKICERTDHTDIPEFRQLNFILELILDKQFYFSKITSKKVFNDKKVVYDFTIPDSHRFYSNGYISHNTTVLENCHPFSRMLTRQGALKDHFFLSDSHRIIVYKTSSGKKIRISMFINGTTNSVPTRYFVETKDDEDSPWKPNKSVDGSLDSYNEWVTCTFGTVDMFLRTSFYANKQVRGIPDISFATKGEKMELFTKLAGTDYLTVISEKAKEFFKEADDEIKELKKDIKDYDLLKDKLAAGEDLIENNTKLIEEEQEQLKKDNEQLKELEEKQREFLEAVGSSNVLRLDVVTKRNRLKKNIDETESIKGDIIALEEMLDEKDFCQSQIDWWNNSIKQEDEIRLQKDGINDAIVRLSAEKTDIQIKSNKLTEELSTHRETLLKHESDIKLLKKSINDINEVCPVCGERLSEHKKEELEKDNEIINKKIMGVNKLIDNVNNDISNVKQQIEENKQLLKENDQKIDNERSKLQEVIGDLNQITEYRLTVDIDKAKHIVNEVEPLLRQREKDLQERFAEKEELEKAIKEIEEQLANIPDDYSDKINRLSNGIRNSQENIANWTAEKNQAVKEIAEVKEKINLVKEVDDRLKELNKLAKDYGIIQKAFSNNGIQALELDSAAPEISVTANNILASTYGDRFQISFDTQRDAADGRKIDDFAIKVFDSKSGRMKKLELLSGGETVWIKNALYYAFSVVRSRRSGFCFKTRFLDESDGTLDSEARIRYLKMIESAHKACNANLTILVTHSPEIKEIVDQKIEL